MQAVVGQYSGSGARELFDALERSTADVERLMRGVPGFVSYSLIRTGDGGLSVTICQDRAGCEDSSRRAREWVQRNVSTTVTPPQVSEGNVILQVSYEAELTQDQELTDWQLDKAAGAFGRIPKSILPPPF